MDVFTQETIYGHMNAEHGGMNDNPQANPVLQANYEEQQEVLRQAQIRRQYADLMQRHFATLAQRDREAENRQRNVRAQQLFAQALARNVNPDEFLERPTRAAEPAERGGGWCTVM